MEPNQTDLRSSTRNKGQSNGHSDYPDRLPPHSIETEQAILGCILLDPGTALPVAIERFGQDYEIFYDLRHRTIYETMCELFEDGAPVDTVTLVERLQMWDKLYQVGGIEYLAQLPEAAPSAANIEYYIETVLEKNVARRMISTCTGVISRIQDHEGDLSELIDQCERDILQISESRVEPADLSMNTLVGQCLTEIEQLHQNQGQISGLETGFLDYDRMTGGLHPGEMIVIAGRPSTGKTALAINIATHVAVVLHEPVGIISLEMTAKALVNRMILSDARVNLRNVSQGFLCERDFPRITTAAGRLNHAPIYIDETSGQSILQIRAKFRRWAQRFGIKLGVIDYIQLANAIGTKRKYENRQQEVSEISVGIKSIAKELNIPILALSQLNREYEREKNRKPRLADLRESGAIEQDADLVGILYTPRKEDEEEPDNGDAIQVNLLIAKQRQGPTGDVPLVFLKQFTRFESAARVTSEDATAAVSQQQQFPDA